VWRLCAVTLRSTLALGALASSPPLGVRRVSANPPHAALFAQPRWRSLHRTAPISDASSSSRDTGAPTPCRPPASAPCTTLTRACLARFTPRSGSSLRPLSRNARALRDAFVVFDPSMFRIRVVTKPRGRVPCSRGHEASAPIRALSLRRPRQRAVPSGSCALDPAVTLVPRGARIAEPRYVRIDSANPNHITSTHVSRCSQRRAMRSLLACTTRLPAGVGSCDRPRALRAEGASMGLGPIDTQCWGTALFSTRGTLRRFDRAWGRALDTNLWHPRHASPVRKHARRAKRQDRFLRERFSNPRCTAARTTREHEWRAVDPRLLRTPQLVSLFREVRCFIDVHCDSRFRDLHNDVERAA
jgi:hypothetical protein